MWLVLAVVIMLAVVMGLWERRRRRVEARHEAELAALRAKLTDIGIVAEVVRVQREGRPHLRRVKALIPVALLAGAARDHPRVTVAAVAASAAVAAGVWTLLDGGHQLTPARTPSTAAMGPDPTSPSTTPSATTTTTRPPGPASATGAGEDAAAPVVAAPSGPGAAVPPDTVDGGSAPATALVPATTTTTMAPTTTTEPPDDDDEQTADRSCVLALELPLLGDLCLLPTQTA